MGAPPSPTTQTQRVAPSGHEGCKVVCFSAHPTFSHFVVSIQCSFDPRGCIAEEPGHDNPELSSAKTAVYVHLVQGWCFFDAKHLHEIPHGRQRLCLGAAAFPSYKPAVRKQYAFTRTHF